MSKYIVEIKPEYEDSFKGLMILGAKDSNLFVDTLAVDDLEQLNSDYINEHYGQLQDEAYQRGLNVAWECARRIIHMPEGDLLNIFTECYSAVCTALQVLLKYDAAEAIEKLKAYEEKKKQDDKIEVGDEVEWDNDFTGDRFIVTRIYQPYGKKEQCDGIDDDGDVYRAVLIESLVKTGRHFDIEKILEEMRE